MTGRRAEEICNRFVPIWICFNTEVKVEGCNWSKNDCSHRKDLPPSVAVSVFVLTILQIIHWFFVYSLWLAATSVLCTINYKLKKQQTSSPIDNAILIA
jgi:hypothetical protein